MIVIKIKTLIACLGAFITLISGVGFNTLNNQKEVSQNENIIIADVVYSENNNDLNENFVIDLEERSNEIVETEEQNIEETQETATKTEETQVNEIKNEAIVKIIEYLAVNGHITTEIGVEITGKSVAQVRRYLKMLCDIEVVKKTKSTKGNVYVRNN